MIIVCPRCGILYGVDPDDLAVASRTVRCSNCDREWLHTPAASLPDSDEALRLLAASLGRDGPAVLTVPSPAPRKVETASAPKPGRRETLDASPARPRVAEPEPVLRPAPVTPLYPAAPTARAPAEEASSAGARLSSRQLDALLNGMDDDAAAQAEPQTARPEPTQADARTGRSEPAKPQPILREVAAQDPAPGAGPPLALNPASVDETAASPSPAPDEAAEETPPAARAPLLRRQRAAVLAAGAVAATLLVSVGLLAGTRGLVMAAFPGAAGFYSAVGLAPADSFAEGLEIRGVSSSRSWSDGEQILTVAGDLANVAEQPRSLPMVRVVLVDRSDAEVQEVVVLPPGETLPVGESIRFEARISNPVDTAERIKVSLAPRPEPS